MAGKIYIKYYYYTILEEILQHCTIRNATTTLYRKNQYNYTTVRNPTLYFKEYYNSVKTARGRGRGRAAECFHRSVRCWHPEGVSWKLSSYTLIHCKKYYNTVLWEIPQHFTVRNTATL